MRWLKSCFELHGGCYCPSFHIKVVTLNAENMDNANEDDSNFCELCSLEFSTNRVSANFAALQHKFYSLYGNSFKFLRILVLEKFPRSTFVYPYYPADKISALYSRASANQKLYLLDKVLIFTSVVYCLVCLYCSYRLGLSKQRENLSLFQLITLCFIPPSREVIYL